MNLDDKQKNIIALFKTDFDLAEMLAISNGYGVWFNQYIVNFCNDFLKFINFNITRCNNIYEANFKDFGRQQIYIDSEMFAHYVVLQMFYYNRQFDIDLQINGHLLVKSGQFGCFLNGNEYIIRYEDFRMFANVDIIGLDFEDFGKHIKENFNITCKMI
jgi:hypothetical protein